MSGRRDIVLIDVDEVYVDNKVVVPLALLINELVSNAFVHAFENSAAPRLQLSFKRESETLMRLVVADNGPGLTEGLEMAKGKTFGFKLISLFARQLKGKLMNQNSRGLRVEVEFQNMVHEVKN
jgi:two-component sensor histidine kinase